ncbi:MAG: heat-shock protein Hsp20 [Pirellula sp.]|nr:heat-shock protein Hsp20 [Pirellula sp.]
MLCEQQTTQQTTPHTSQQACRPAQPTPAAQPTQAPRHFVPQVDVVELPQEFVLTADLPGAAAGAIDVDYVDGELRLHAPVAPRKAEAGRYLLEEYAVGSYRRVFQLGKSIDASRISANYHAGVLTLHLPKVEALQPRRVTVRTA